MIMRSTVPVGPPTGVITFALPVESQTGVMTFAPRF